MDRSHGGGQDEQSSQFLGGYSALGEDGEISVEGLQSLLKELDDIPDEFWMGQDNQGVAGTVQHGAPQGISGELNLSNGFHLQSGDFGNQPVAGTEQQAPGALEFVDNGIQTMSSYDKELNMQQSDVDILGIQQLWMTQLGQPGTLNSIDQVSLLPVCGTQLLENQMPAAIQPLIQQQFDQAAATVDSRSTRIIGESKISEAEWKRLVKKRECDRRYRTKEKVKKKKLEMQNEEFRAQNEELRAQIEVLRNVVLELEHKAKSNHLKLESCNLKMKKVEAENEDLKEKLLLLKGRCENAMWLLGEIKSMKKQVGKQGIKEPKRKLKKQVMMVGTAEETKNDD